MRRANVTSYESTETLDGTFWLEPCINNNNSNNILYAQEMWKKLSHVYLLCFTRVLEGLLASRLNEFSRWFQTLFLVMVNPVRLTGVLEVGMAPRRG